MSCSGPCDQGRRRCPTREACYQPIDEPLPQRGYGRLISAMVIGTLALVISALL